MKVAVSTITCRFCGRVVRQSIPRVAHPDEIEQEGRPCSPAFAQTAGCPDHPPRPPANGLHYGNAAPLLWSVRILEVPA